jgi:uncharacterized protein
MAAKFEIKRSSNGFFTFSLKAANNEIILSSETYSRRLGAVRGVESVKKNGAIDQRFQKKTASNGEAYFILKASNGKTLARSETYKTERACDNGIESVKKNAPVAAVVDLT